MANTDLWEREVREQVDALRRSTTRACAAWAETDRPAPNRQDGGAPAVARHELTALASYYRRKRLACQENYFRKRAEALRRAGWARRAHVPVVLFFGSVLCVVVHAVLYLVQEGPSRDAAQEILLVLGAVLPILGFGLRAWLAAFETPRQAVLFAAKAHAVAVATVHLDAAGASPSLLLSRIREDERFFENEHREWCRLQFATEWFL